MKHTLTAGLLVAFASAAHGAPTAPPLVIVQPPAPATIAPALRASEAEALAFVRAFSPSDIRRRGEAVVLEKNFVPALKKDPATAALLDTFPSLGNEMVKAMESQLDLYIAEFDETFFPRAAAIVVESVSRDDVLSLTAFYTSPLGRKTLLEAVENIDASELAERAINGQAIDAAVTERQVMRTGITTFVGMTPDERKELLQVIYSPAGRRFAAIRPKIGALQTELLNNPGPRFRAGSHKAMSEAFERVTGIDPEAAQGKPKAK